MPFRLFRGLVAIGLLAAMVMPAQAAILTFNSLMPATNAATRSTWLAAVGIGTPENLVDFETGFVHNQNISGVTGLFPDGLVITDTSPAASALIRTGATIGGTSPVGNFGVMQNEGAYLELDFSASPVDYIGFQDIDHTQAAGIVTFVGGATAVIPMLEVSGAAEFYAIFRNDMPQIVRLQFDADGDGRWGFDNIEYGALQQAGVPEPTTLTLWGLGALGCAVAGYRRRKLAA
jgi:hypothetical protein